MIFQGKTTDDGEYQLDELIEDVEEVDGAFMDIGWQEDGERHPGGEYTVAEVAAVLEFGTKDGRIPGWSALRLTTDEQWDRWGERGDRGLDRIADGHDALQELTAVGQLAASDLKRKITVLREPPNTQSTIDRKGSSNPLIDTGFTRASASSRVVVGFKERTVGKGAKS